MEKYKGGFSGRYSKVLRMNIPMNNNLLIKNKYISSLINNNYIKYTNLKTLNNNKINIVNIYI